MKNGVAFVAQLILVLYANCIGAIYNGQSSVVSSTMEDRHLATALFAISTDALAAGL
jgi:hypothetical protein